MVAHTQSYIEVSLRLDEACEWFHELGIQYSTTRLGRYRAIWKRLAELQRSSDISAFFQEYTFSQWVNAASETSQIVDIFDGLRGDNSAGLIDRLRTSLRGHEMYVLDTDDRSGRDFTFELLVAARFGRSGFKVNFSSAADVEVDFNGATLHVECKRLKSPRKVQKRIKEATKQLHRRYVASSSPSTARGIVAVSISKVVNPERGLLEAASPDLLSESASRHVARFIDTYRKYWQDGSDKRTLGAVVFLDAPGIQLPTQMLWSVSEIGVNNSCPPSSQEYRQLVAIAENALARNA